MNGFLFFLTVIGTLFVGAAAGCFVTILYVRLNRERSKKRYCYKGTIRKRSANEMGDLNKIDRTVRGGVDGARALDEFDVGGAPPASL